MARVSCVLLLFTLVALAASFPNQQWRSPTQDDVVIVPLEDGRPRDVEESSEEDFGVRRSPDDYESPWSGSFSNFFQGMQAMMWQLRNQMQEVLRRIPQETLEGSSGFEIGQPWNGIPGNTTSTTKVINGHVVTVNETTYTRGTNGSSAVFHIKVVDIKPQQSALEGENAGPSAETVEVTDSQGSLPSLNSQSSEDSDELSPAMAWWRAEMARNPLYAPRQPGIKGYPKKPVFQNHFGHESLEDDSSANDLGEDAEEFEWKNGEGSNSPVIDLSRDTLVNQLMSDQQRKGGLVAVHPDAEILDVEDGKVLGTVDDMLQQKASKPSYTKPIADGRRTPDVTGSDVAKLHGMACYEGGHGAVYYVKHFDAEYILRHATKNNAITDSLTVPQDCSTPRQHQLREYPHSGETPKRDDLSV